MKNKDGKENFSPLRKKAEKLVKKTETKSASGYSEADTLKLIHELKVHQIELELQNEELVRAKEEAAALATEKYAELYNFAPSGYLTLSKDGEIIELNLSAANLLGKERSRLVKSRFLLFVSNDFRPVFNNFLGKILNGNIKETCELSLSVKDKTPVYVQLSGIASQSKEQCFLSMVDINNIKQAEITLHESEERFVKAFQSNPAAISISRLHDGLFVDVNDSFLKVFGYKRDEVIGKKVTDIKMYTNIQDRDNMIKLLQKDGRFINYELTALTKNGEKLITLVSAEKIYYHGQEHILYSTLDITGRKKNEDILRESKEQLSVVFNGVSETIMLLDIEGTVLAANEIAIKRLNNGNPDLIGKNIYDIVPPDYIETREKQIAELVSTRKPVKFMDHLGNTVLEMSFYPVFDTQGNVKQFISSALDITERLRADEALRESEQKLKFHFENSPLAVVEWDSNYVVTQWSKEAERIFGWRKEETIGQRIDLLNLIYEEDIPIVNRTMERLSSGNEALVVSSNRNITKSGEIIECTWYNSILLDHNKQMKSVMSLVQDITESKNSEKAIKESEEKFSSLFYSSPIAKTLSSLDDGKYQDINEAFLRDTGYTKDEVMGRTSEELSIFTNINDRENLIKKVKKDGHVYGAPCELKIKNGTILSCLVSINVVTINMKKYMLSTIQDISENLKIKEALVQSEERFKAMAEVLPVAMAVTGYPDGKFIYMNPAYKKQLGYTEEDYLDKKTPDLYFDSNEREVILGKLKKDNVLTNHEIQIKRKDGTSFWVLLSLSYISYQKESAILGTFIDISERKTAEKKLQLSEEKFRRLAESAFEGLLVHDNGVIIDYNTPIIDLTGYSHDEMSGKNILDFVLPEYHSLMKEKIREPYEIEIVHKNGEKIPVEVMVKPYAVQGQLVAAIRDLRERKKAEEALKESEEKFKAIFESNSSAIAIIEPDTTISMVNDAYCQLGGYTKEEVLGMSWTSQIPPDDLERLKDYNSKRLKNPKDAPDKYEFKFYRKNGQVRHALMSVSMVPGINKIITSFVDITERKLAEDALKNNIRLLENVMDGSPSPIFLKDREGKFITINASLEKMLGVSRQDLKGKTDYDIAPKDVADHWKENDTKVVETGKSIQIEELADLNDGHHIFLANKFPLKDAQGYVYGVGSISHDITERKKTEDALKESEEKFSKVFKTSPFAIALSEETTGVLHEVNPAWEKIYGFSREEAIGKSSTELQMFFDTNERKQMLTSLNHSNGLSNYEMIFRLPNNKNIVTELAGSKIELEGRKYIIVISQDITQRKMAEEALKEAQLRTTTVMNSIADTFYSLDDEWRFTEINPAAERAPFGRPASEMLGKVIWDLFPNLVGTFIHQHYLNAAEKHSLEQYVGLSPLNGRWYEVFMKGRKGGVDVYMRDITERKQAEEALRENENRLNAALDAGELGSWGLDIKTKTAWRSLRHDQIFGYKELLPEWTYDMFLEHVIAEDKEQVDYKFGKALETLSDWDFECRIKKVDGEIRWIWAQGKPQVNDQNVVVTLSGFVKDITTRKKIEEDLKESEEKLWSILNATQESIYMFDKDYKFTMSNSTGLKRMNNISEAELIGHHFAEFMTIDLANQRKDKMDEVFKTKNAVEFEDDRIGKTFHHHFFPVLKNDEVSNIVVYSTDITERKQIENTLLFLLKSSNTHHEENFFRSLAVFLAESTSMDFVCIDTLSEDKHSAKTLAIYFDGKFDDNIEYTLKETPCGEVVGKNICSYNENVRALFPKDEVLQEMKAESYLGATLWSSGGLPIGLIALISREPRNNFRIEETVLKLVAIRAAGELERMQTELLVSNSETRYRRLFESAKDGILILDADTGVVVEVNPYLLEKLGYSHEMFLGKTLWDIGLFKDIIANQDNFRKLQLKDYLRYDNLPLETADGQLINVEFVSNVYLVNDKRVIQCNIRDITERKKAENELYDTKNYLENLINYANAPIIVWNSAYEIQLFNRAFENLTGYFSDEVIGKKLDFLFPDESLDASKEKIKRALSEHLESIEIPILCKDKDVKTFLWNSANIYNAEDNALISTIAQGNDITERLKFEKALKESEANYHRLFEYSAIPIWKEDYSEIKKFIDNLISSGVDDFRSYFNTHKDEVNHLASLIRVIEINQKSVEFFGADNKDDVIRNMLFYYNEEALDIFREQLIVLAEGGKMFEFEMPIRILSGDIKILNMHLSIVKGYEDTLSNVLVSFIDLTERKAYEEELIRSKEDWVETFDLIPDMITILDTKHRIVRANKAATEKLGTPITELLGTHCYQCVHGMKDSPAFCPHSMMLMDGKEHVVEVHEDKLNAELLVSVTPIFDKNSNITGSVHIARDITEQKKKEKYLYKLNRTLSALGKSSQEMTRAKDEADYLSEVCKIIINHCGYKMVWVGYAENDEEKSVRPVAFHGFDEGYLETLNVTWDDSERGRGPTGIAIRTGQPALSRDIQTDSALQPWRNDAIKRGYQSSIVFPLKSDRRVFGAITIYSNRQDAFSEDEIALLSEIANDLAYGIISIRSRIAQREAEDALRKSEAQVRVKLQSILSPEGNIKQLELPDIIDIPAIQTLMDNLYSLVQIPMAIVDMKGRVIVQVGWQDICTKFHRIHPETAMNCVESDVILSGEIPEGEYKLYKCKNNLWDMATPVVIGGEQKGNLFLGQFFFEDEKVDYDYFRQQAIKFGFNEKEYVDALKRVPRLSREKLDYAKSFFLGLAQSLSQLSYSNIRLARSISEQERIGSVLKEKNAELEESNASKDKFFRIIAHDMKNPYISLIGASELLYENAHKYTAEKVATLTKVLHESAKSGYDMLLNMLDWSRSQAGSMMFQPEKINLIELINKEHVSLTEFAFGKKIKLDFEIPKDLHVLADKNMLNTILRNLINNALKFTAKGGKVTVSTKQENGSVIIYVKDTGMGINKNDFDKLFRYDIKFSNPGTEHEHGTGLGLLLCKEFVEKHGGKIWIESEIDKGSTFYFSLGKYEN